MRTIAGDLYQKASQLFPWATREHYVVWFTGENGRHKRTEVILPRLVKKGKLIAVKFGNCLVYAAPKYKRIDRSNPANIYHGLGVTEGLVRIWRSDMTGTIIPSSYFRGLGAVPEWGISNNGSLLLYEFSTYDNFYRRLNEKLKRYSEVLPDIKVKFNAQPGVLFVCDVKPEAVMNFIQRYKPTGPFLYTDYATFKSVPIGEQLKAKIYMEGDGNIRPLRYV